MPELEKMLVKGRVDGMDGFRSKNFITYYHIDGESVGFYHSPKNYLAIEANEDIRAELDRHLMDKSAGKATPIWHIDCVVEEVERNGVTYRNIIARNVAMKEYDESVPTPTEKPSVIPTSFPVLGVGGWNARSFCLRYIADVIIAMPDKPSLEDLASDEYLEKVNTLVNGWTKITENRLDTSSSDDEDVVY